MAPDDNPATGAQPHQPRPIKPYEQLLMPWHPSLQTLIDAWNNAATTGQAGIMRARTEYCRAVILQTLADKADGQPTFLDAFTEILAEKKIGRPAANLEWKAACTAAWDQLQRLANDATELRGSWNHAARVRHGELVTANREGVDDTKRNAMIVEELMLQCLFTASATGKPATVGQVRALVANISSDPTWNSVIIAVLLDTGNV